MRPSALEIRPIVLFHAPFALEGFRTGHAFACAAAAAVLVVADFVGILFAGFGGRYEPVGIPRMVPGRYGGMTTDRLCGGRVVADLAAAMPRAAAGYWAFADVAVPAMSSMRVASVTGKVCVFMV